MPSVAFFHLHHLLRRQSERLLCCALFTFQAVIHIDHIDDHHTAADANDGLLMVGEVLLPLPPTRDHSGRLRLYLKCHYN